MAEDFLFSLPGITCQGCVGGLRQELDSLKLDAQTPIKSHSISIPAKTILITVDETSLSRAEISLKLKAIIEGTGLDCEEIEAIAAEADIEMGELKPLLRSGKKITRPNSFTSHLIRGILGLTLGFGLMIATWIGLSFSASIMYALIAVSSLATIALGMESYIDASKKFIKSRTLTMDALFTVSSLTALLVTIAHIFIPWLPMMMEAGVLIFGFRHIGQAIKESINRRFTQQLTFSEKAPKRIEREVALDQWEMVPVLTLEPTHIIRVKSGAAIPVDGVCLEKDASLYKTIVTGHPMPVAVKIDEEIAAGMVVPDDLPYLRMRVTQTAANSLLARKDRAILRANEKRAPIELIADRILQYFVPGAILLALLTGIGVGFLFNLPLAIRWSAALLNAVCPCTFGFLLALANQQGMAAALKNGINIKTSEELETASTIQKVACDLNGTMTTGVPTVSTHHICFEKGISPQQFTNYLHEIENKSGHPFARAICTYLQKSITFDLDCTASDVDLRNHSGIKAKIKDQCYLVGNSQFLEDHGISVKDLNPSPSPIEQVIYFARLDDKAVLGYLKIKDPLRADAIATVKALQKQGKEVFLITGADRETALRYAALLGIPEHNVHAACLDKLAKIAELKKQGPVTMIGDASNDAEAVTASTLGIAIKSHSGCEITQDRAGAIIENPNLMSIANLFTIANATSSNIKQNLFISIAYNALIFLVEGGLLLYKNITIPAGIAAGLMIAQTCLILLNQYRISRQNFTPPRVAMDEVSEEEQPTTHRLLQQQGLLPIRPELREEVDIDAQVDATRKMAAASSLAQAPSVNIAIDEMEMANVVRSLRS